MLYHERIYVSEVIDVNKTSAYEERIISHYWHFLDKGFRLHPAVCNGCHDCINNICWYLEHCYFKHLWC